MTSSVRLYLTADRTAVVPEGDKRAAFLLVAAGEEIPESVVKKYNLAAINPTIPEREIEERKTRVPRKLKTR